MRRQTNWSPAPAITAGTADVLRIDDALPQGVFNRLAGNYDLRNTSAGPND
jgi:hypothetical protein